MKKIVFIFSFVFITILYSFAQETILYGIRKTNTPQECFVVAFDYFNQTCDTLFYLPYSTVVTNGCITFDSFRKIFYYYSSTGDISAINIDSSDYYTIANISGQINDVVSSLEYDYFSNSLIFQDKNTVKRFNLNTNTVELISDVYQVNILSFIPKSVYNQKLQRFVSVNSYKISSDTDQFYTLQVDCKNKEIIDTINLNNNSVFGGLTYNYVDNNYYAYNFDQKKVIRINSLTGEQTFVSYFNYHSMLNFQRPAFDCNNGLYLFPYFSGSEKLAIVDINTGNIDSIDFYMYDYQSFYGGKRPFLIRDDNFLLGSYGENYTWYLNDNIIQDSISQTLFPAVAGYYKFSTYIGANQFFSNEVYFDFNSVHEKNNNEINVVIFPNPTTNNLIIETLEKAIIEILNIEGQIIKIIKHEEKETIIDVSNLAIGIYFVKVKTEKEIIVKKFIKD
jgi:hypothetical protein